MADFCWRQRSAQRDFSSKCDECFHHRDKLMSIVFQQYGLFYQYLSNISYYKLYKAEHQLQQKKKRIAADSEVITAGPSKGTLQELSNEDQDDQISLYDESEDSDFVGEISSEEEEDDDTKLFLGPPPEFSEGDWVLVAFKSQNSDDTDDSSNNSVIVFSPLVNDKIGCNDFIQHNDSLNSESDSSSLKVFLKHETEIDSISSSSSTGSISSKTSGSSSQSTQLEGGGQKRKKRKITSIFRTSPTTNCTKRNINFSKKKKRIAADSEVITAGPSKGTLQDLSDEDQDDQISLYDESEDSDFVGEISSEEEEDDDTKLFIGPPPEFSVGDWVLVAFKSQSRDRNDILYIGHVISLNGNDTQVKFLRKKTNRLFSNIDETVEEESDLLTCDKKLVPYSDSDDTDDSSNNSVIVFSPLVNDKIGCNDFIQHNDSLNSESDSSSLKVFLKHETEIDSISSSSSTGSISSKTSGSSSQSTQLEGGGQKRKKRK
uniref:Dentin sialophosphoprotein-like n=1 Tax=Diabrotica virgifera virgifera TaxID=50390 RepID=A0A6P7GI86_DIAVI